MTDKTINNAVTLGGPDGTLLANRYRVIRQLGQGGMGSVWLAKDTQLDNREVAIKMLPSILVSNRRAYKQLKSEALVSLKLTHPNIATVRAFEENGGNPFLVVDYIDGQTLDDYLADKGKLSEDETIRLLGPIAAALDYAHGEGVVHRDVKPGNIMIRKDGHPFILDFGIAREMQETMTRVTGKLSSGTLMYMSPEQLHGAAPKLSQDVYSFAAMAYECLMGTPPFSRGQIEYQIEHDSPAPLDSHIIISGSVIAGLEKCPEDRPVNCASVLAGGGRGATALPVECSGADGNGRVRTPVAPPQVGRARAPREPRRWGVVIAISLLAILSVVGFGSLIGRQPAGADGACSLPKRAVGNSADSSGVENDSSFPKERNRKPGEVKTITLPGGAKLELVWCPPGSFTMGSQPDENGRSGDENQHQVIFTNGFWIGRYEVTQRQWESVMGTNPSNFKGGNRPVESVSWDDCQDFCRKSDLRLPTEAEWEYACRAGTTTPYAGSGQLDDMGWCQDYGKSKQETHDVGTKNPNDWGIFDMHGNVYEWCADWYGDYGNSATNPICSVWSLFRVGRGGCWSHSTSTCRSAYRRRFFPSGRTDNVGFRVACFIVPSE